MRGPPSPCRKHRLRGSAELCFAPPRIDTPLTGVFAVRAQKIPPRFSLLRPAAPLLPAGGLCLQRARFGVRNHRSGVDETRGSEGRLKRQ